jgi:hypothetical protein
MLYGDSLQIESHMWMLFSDKLLAQTVLPRRCGRWVIDWLVRGATPSSPDLFCANKVLAWNMALTQHLGVVTQEAMTSRACQSWRASLTSGRRALSFAVQLPNSTHVRAPIRPSTFAWNGKSPGFAFSLPVPTRVPIEFCLR